LQLNNIGNTIVILLRDLRIRISDDPEQILSCEVGGAITTQSVLGAIYWLLDCPARIRNPWKLEYLKLLNIIGIRFYY
jgi:hypothetical protein